MTNITYRFEEASDGMVDLYLYFMGEKTYDCEGAERDAACKLYDVK